MFLSPRKVAGLKGQVSQLESTLSALEADYAELQANYSKQSSLLMRTQLELASCEAREQALLQIIEAGRDYVPATLQLTSASTKKPEKPEEELIRENLREGAMLLRATTDDKERELTARKVRDFANGIERVVDGAVLRLFKDAPDEFSPLKESFVSALDAVLGAVSSVTASSRTLIADRERLRQYVFQSRLKQYHEASGGIQSSLSSQIARRLSPHRPTELKMVLKGLDAVLPKLCRDALCGKVEGLCGHRFKPCVNASVERGEVSVSVVHPGNRWGLLKLWVLGAVAAVTELGGEAVGTVGLMRVWKNIDGDGKRKSKLGAKGWTEEMWEREGVEAEGVVITFSGQ